MSSSHRKSSSSAYLFADMNSDLLLTASRAFVLTRPPSDVVERGHDMTFDDMHLRFALVSVEALAPRLSKLSVTREDRVHTKLSLSTCL